MESRLHFDILPQPDPTTCGPTCLHAVYRYHGDEMPLARVIAETPALEEGGTLAVLLSGREGMLPTAALAYAEGRLLRDAAAARTA